MNKKINYLFCDCCGDSVNIAMPTKLVFSDGIILSFNICLECLNDGVLEINLHRKRLVSKILQKIKQNWDNFEFKRYIRD